MEVIDLSSTVRYLGPLYGFYSSRSGGATFATWLNSYLSEKLLKLHGRRKSESAKDVYVRMGSGRHF